MIQYKREIVEKVYSTLAGGKPYLIGVKWEACSTHAEMVLLLGQSVARLRLDGVHFFGSRQSMIGRHLYHPPSYEFREDWGVDYFDIVPDSPFLAAFLDRRLGFPGDIMLYDTRGNSGAALPQTGPVHVAVYSNGGYFDIVCETVTLAFDSETMTNTK